MLGAWVLEGKRGARGAWKGATRHGRFVQTNGGEQQNEPREIFIRRAFVPKRGRAVQAGRRIVGPELSRAQSARFAPAAFAFHAAGCRGVSDQAAARSAISRRSAARFARIDGVAFRHAVGGRVAQTRVIFAERLDRALQHGIVGRASIPSDRLVRALLPRVVERVFENGRSRS